MYNFLNPKNIGEMRNPDGFAEIGNPVCGDMLSFFIKVKDGKIKDVKFLSFGCASNIATASMLTQKIKGMSVEKAKKFDWNSIVKALDGLPKQKIHCSILAVEGLKKAIEDYEKKKGKKKKKKK